MISGAALLAAVLAAPTPSGGIAVTPVRLTVRSASDCVSQSEVAARVTSRSSRIHFVEDDTALSIDATFKLAQSGDVVTSFVLTEPDGTSMSRHFLASSCAEAADAVALIIAVTLDPESATARGPTIALRTAGTPSADTSRGTQPSATKPTPEPKTAREERMPPAQVEPLARPAPQAVVTAPPAAPVATRRRTGAQVGAQTVLGPAPSAMLGIAVHAIAALDRDSLWSPAVALGGMYVWRGGFVEPGGTASFALLAASLDACALRVRLSSVEIRACGSALAGRLATSGSDTLHPASATRPFVVLGVTALVTVNLGARFELATRIASGVTLLRDWYVFGPTQFHRAGLLTTTASLSFGVRWP